MEKILDLDTKLISKMVNGKNILITGGTGSFGNCLSYTLCNFFSPNKLVILSRDEYKQSIMQQKFSEDKYECMRYFIGDVRDGERLDFAFKGVDIVFHAAALKQVPSIEYNPTEAIKTNIRGTENVINAAIKNNVKKVIALSTDKCVAPCNLYGATKLCLEKLIVAANNLSGGSTKFSVLRYGNVLGSRGSVLPIFLKQIETGILTVTDETMTRFTITINEAINFVLNCAYQMIGGEIFVPKLPSYGIMQLAKVISPEAKIKIIGIRPGEKIHELMIGIYESYLAIDCGTYYVIKPTIKISCTDDFDKYYRFGKEIGVNKEYSSDKNLVISDGDLNLLIDEYKRK
jgi:UDP-N-acetylglucosamine 4,6-dehydratase/5-epimerase